MNTRRNFLLGFLSGCLLLTSIVAITGAGPKGVADQTQTAIQSEDIVPSDTVNLANGPCRASYWGTGGDVATVDIFDHVTIYHNVPSGSYVLQMVKRINATGTTASQGTAAD